MVSRSNSASQALYNLTASSPSASLYDDESQLLTETELDTLGDDGQSPAGVRRRKLTCWPLMVVLDALGLLALAGVAQTTDSSQPITPTAWLAATAVLALVFGTFALLPMSKLAYHLHLHAFGFAYCMLIHAGLRVRVGSPAVHRLSDTMINWPFLVLVTPLCYVFGACATLREQPGIDLAALLPASIANALQALLTAFGAAPLPGGADARQALAAHTHNFGYYFVPFLGGMLPNFLAKLGVLPDFSLSVRSMPTWGSGQYLSLWVCALLLAHLLGYHLWRAKQEGLLRGLGLFYVPTLLGLAVTITLLRSTHAVHLHHYFTAALLVPLTRLPGRVPALWQALLVGFHLQGIAIFGIEPLFYPIHAGLPLM